MNRNKFCFCFFICLKCRLALRDNCSPLSFWPLCHCPLQPLKDFVSSCMTFIHLLRGKMMGEESGNCVKYVAWCGRGKKLK